MEINNNNFHSIYRRNDCTAEEAIGDFERKSLTERISHIFQAIFKKLGEMFSWLKDTFKSCFGFVNFFENRAVSQNNVVSQDE